MVVGAMAQQAHYVPPRAYAHGIVVAVAPPAAPEAPAPQGAEDRLVLKFMHQSANCCQQPGPRQFWGCAFALRLSIVYQQCWCMHVPVCVDVQTYLGNFCCSSEWSWASIPRAQRCQTGGSSLTANTTCRRAHGCRTTSTQSPASP